MFFAEKDEKKLDNVINQGLIFFVVYNMIIFIKIVTI